MLLHSTSSCLPESLPSRLPCSNCPRSLWDRSSTHSSRYCHHLVQCPANSKAQQIFTQWMNKGTAVLLLKYLKIFLQRFLQGSESSWAQIHGPDEWFSKADPHQSTSWWQTTKDAGSPSYEWSFSDKLRKDCRSVNSWSWPQRRQISMD